MSLGLKGLTKQNNEPHHEKERVKIRATFQSCRPKTLEMSDLKKPKNKRHVYESGLGVALVPHISCYFNCLSFRVFSAASLIFTWSVS